jgi:processive 1,2-diacylglycerol beta-glucosyltransferase
MAEYMKLSDVVITKAGGLTTSECLTLKKPIIMINPIPGQEEYNAKFIEKNNFGKQVKNIDEIIAVLPEMLVMSKNKQIDLLEPENPSKKIFEKLV